MVEGQPTKYQDDELEHLVQCDLCGAPRERSRPLFPKQGLPVNRCEVCGVIYVNPRLRQDLLWQRYSQNYFQNEYLPAYGQYDEEHNYAIYKGHLQELERYVPRGRLFEFGSATGFFLAAARRGGWEVAGNELSSFAANYARQHLDIPITPGRAEDMQLQPASFDAVVLWETIEHVQSPRRVLSKAAEILRPGGVLALSTPNIQSISFSLLRDRWWVVAPREHIFYFAPKTIAYLLNRVGLKVRAIFTAGSDLHCIYYTLRGRTVMPAHLRAADGREPTKASRAGSLLSQPMRWGQEKVGPRLRSVVQRALHRTMREDQLVVYATKEGS
jgi:2-polyprenyl-3-methyl-5-hydroxy-6-metoxy-1,4-benzoquinol methylase